MRAHNRAQSLLLAPAVYCLLGFASMALAADKLGSYAIDQKAISASGISSGGFMAQQFHVAHSAEIMGAGIVAAGPYNCANSKPGWPAICAAMDVCSHTAASFVPFMGPPNPQRSIRATQDAARQHKIDPTSGLRHDKVFLFSGMKDSEVPQSVMTSLDEYYSHFIQARNIVYVTDVPAEHAMITNDFGNACDALKTPFINNCNYDLAGKILEHIYPGLNPAGDPATGKMIEFDQTEFFPPGGSVSLNQVGHLFVPAGCQGAGGCRLHIAFHGCKQDQEEIGDAYYQHAGYNKWAATNKIIVLYPQTTASAFNPMNPQSCWDWWGYTGKDFYLKTGKQIMVVQNMINRLAAK